MAVASTEKFPDFIQNLLKDIKVPEVDFKDLYSEQELLIFETQDQMDKLEEIQLSDEILTNIEISIQNCNYLTGFPNAQKLVSILSGLIDIISNGIVSEDDMIPIHSMIDLADDAIVSLVNDVLDKSFDESVEDLDPSDENVDNFFTDGEFYINKYNNLYKSDFPYFKMNIYNNVIAAIDSTKDVKDQIFRGARLALVEAKDDLEEAAGSSTFSRGAEGNPEGEPEGEPEGNPEGNPEGEPEGNAEGNDEENERELAWSEVTRAGGSHGQKKKRKSTYRRTQKKHH